MRRRSEDTAAPMLPAAPVRSSKPSRKRGGQILSFSCMVQAWAFVPVCLLFPPLEMRSTRSDITTSTETHPPHYWKF